MIKTIKVEYVPLVQRIVTRFIKIFFIGAIASVFVVPPLQGLDPVSLEVFALAVLNGALAGGFAALEKWVNETK